MKTKFGRFIIPATGAGCLLAMGSPANATTVALNPWAMPLIATIDPAYQSYNVEMVSIIGGDWWAPYDTVQAAPATPTANGISASAFSRQAPLDLTDPRLRLLATALSPAYMRVSDKWANSTFFQTAGPAGPPPAGFDAVLTAPQWQGVLDFSKDVGAKLMTSFAISPGVRNGDGAWTPTQAAKILDYTAKSGGTIAAAEFFNEPNLAVIEGAPKGYDAAQYGRDFDIFAAYLRSRSPTTMILGPGAVGERRGFATLPGALRSEDMLRASGSGLDGLSYHFYGAFSQRCQSMGSQFQTTPAAALAPAWLNASLGDTAFYRQLRDAFTPGKPLWLTETSQAACGGDLWAADFIDTFRYLNQLGLLARNGVSMSMHNTLIGSDYGLIDARTMRPRPNYWGALLWRKLVGTNVLDTGAPAVANLYLYAFDLRGRPGGVTIMAINADPGRTVTLALGVAFTRYTLTAPSLLGTEVRLNGRPLELAADGGLPVLKGQLGRGTAALAPQSISFFEIAPQTKRR